MEAGNVPVSLWEARFVKWYHRTDLLICAMSAEGEELEAIHRS